jgi:hypothetical protein
MHPKIGNSVEKPEILPKIANSIKKNENSSKS